MWKGVLIFAAAAALAGCATGGVADGVGGENFAALSPLGSELKAADARALKTSFVQAMEAGAAGERFDWKGPGAFGWVKAREARLGNLKADPDDRPPMPKSAGIDRYAVTRNPTA